MALNQVVLRWELDPPAFSASERFGTLAGPLGVLSQHGLIRSAMKSGEATCTECGENREVIFLQQVVAETACEYIACPTCGPTKLRPGQLDRFVIDTRLLLNYLFTSVRRSIRPIVSDHLWQVGRITIESRSREIWFVRGLGTKHRADILDRLGSHPKTIVFTPSEAMANFYAQYISNTIMPLEAIIDHDEQRWQIDLNAIVNRVLEAHEQLKPVPTVNPKRASRTAKIERLIDELKVYLRSAADYAQSTSDNGDGPALLPRPTQEQLGRLAGMSKVDVTRCMKDTSANELRLLWQTAGDPNAILRLPREFSRRK